MATIVTIALIAILAGYGISYIVGILVGSGIATWLFAGAVGYVLYKKFGERLNAYFAERRGARAAKTAKKA